jgi:hypothetical protein
MGERPQYVLELSEDHVQLSEEEIARLRADATDALANHQLMLLPPGMKMRRLDAGAPQAQMDRLLALLALSPEERTFVTSALTGGDGEDFWQVFADYLEEKGVAGAERIRRTAPVSEPAAPTVEVRMAQPEERRLGIVRVDLYILAGALHLPQAARIVRVSDQAYFSSGQLGLMIHDPALPETMPGNQVPEVTATYHTADDGQIVVEWRL